MTTSSIGDTPDLNPDHLYRSSLKTRSSPGCGALLGILDDEEIRLKNDRQRYSGQAAEG